jgi:hypothetical protein
MLIMLYIEWNVANPLGFSVLGKLPTPLAEGNKIQYDFVKPHLALDEKPRQK